MKLIPLRTGTFDSKEVFIQAVRSMPQGGDLLELRKRVRVLDQIEKATDDKILIEDQDHECLVKALETQPWAVAHADLLAIIDDAINATTLAKDTSPVARTKGK